jgi:MFS transporter, ACDE family, multidrug resistance protein
VAGSRRSVLTVSSTVPRQRVLLALVFAVTLTSIMGNSLLSPAIPDILDEFDRPDSAGGLLIAVTSLPGILVAPLIGLLADRFGRRRTLVPCLAVFGAAGIVAVTAPTFEVMLAARFAMGFGAAGLVNLAITLIGDTFTGERRTFWIGKNAGVLTAALAVFPLIAGFVTELAGWRWALAPYGLGLATAAAAWSILPPDGGRTTVPFRQQLAGIGDTLRNPTILATFVGGGLGFAAMFGVFLAVLPTHLENEFGLGAGWRGVVIGLPAVTSSIAAFNLTRIRRRVPTGRLLVGSALLWLVAFGLIGLAGAIAVLVVGALLYGLGEGSMFPSMQDVAITEAPDEQRASVMATWTGFARIGQTTGPLLAGLVLAIADSTAAMLVGCALAGAMMAAFGLTGIRHRP